LNEEGGEERSVPPTVNRLSNDEKKTLQKRGQKLKGILGDPIDENLAASLSTQPTTPKFFFLSFLPSFLLSFFASFLLCLHLLVQIFGSFFSFNLEEQENNNN